MPTKKNHFTITEAAKKLGVTRQAVHDAIRKKQLKAKRGKIVQIKTVKTTIVGWQISPESLKEYEVSRLHQDAGKKITDA
jgi:hypothetical protein